ncbi:dynein light chain Tctex-type 5-A-like [Hyla sarda]|uniref:dynein light chain Tctex-type 5-A-like n=1 Tax=Hyla sarda TaxID=327740 RepID=UPI0024C313AC|nr:dynein light chain Tctex-type 5-A-like [Hyla sarda]
MTIDVRREAAQPGRRVCRFCQMDQPHESDLKRWIYSKPKQHQKRNEGEALRSQAVTPLFTGGQRCQETGMRRRTATQEQPKPTTQSRHVVDHSSVDPDFDLHPHPSRVFSSDEALRVMKSILDAELGDCVYEATGSRRRAMELAELVKAAVRDLGYERYKLVCYVVLGPVSGGTVSCCSRSVWSPKSDTYAEYLFRNQSLFALCIVYAGYYE